MIYYKHKDKYLFSLKDEYCFCKVSETEALGNCDEIYFLTKLKRDESKKTYAIACEEDIYLEKESLDLLRLSETYKTEEAGEGKVIPLKIKSLIEQRRIKAVNTEYEDFESCFFREPHKKYRVNILALGDVGSSLLIGLKLMGGQCLDSIGIYDRSEDKIKRWEYEMNQTSYPFEFDSLPAVQGITRDELFDCDMFVFCASKGVPPVGAENIDVRMVQLAENSKLVKEYAEIASQKSFKGVFAVVSDPVDPLCRAALEAGSGKLAPEQIKGYGLGVMNARAAYYAKKHERFFPYLTEGRAFGPHGKGLFIANSIENYDDELSGELTELTVKANLEVRKTGFKPFVAPALSSGAISIIHTLEGRWHYSSNFIGGVYMGAKNRNTPSGLEIERIKMPELLFERLKETYEYLKTIK